VGEVKTVTSTRKTPKLVNQIMTTAWLSMASYGYSELGHRGETCQNAFVLWESVATRFYRWQKAGVWNQILEQLEAMADQQGMLDWEIHYVDGTVVRAHQDPAGGKKGAMKTKL
jgi:transposase